jgi:hypothetical protein
VINSYTIIYLTGSGPTWDLVSAKGNIVYTITNCPKKEDALEYARKWATSWYNYRIEDRTDGEIESQKKNKTQASSYRE